LANLKQFFVRPRTYPEIATANAEMAVKRAKDNGDVQQVKVNYYYIPGWFDKLGDKWRMKDAVVFFTINFAQWASRSTVRKDDDPVALRETARVFGIASRRMSEYGDELLRRAELIDLDESPEKDSQSEAID
jgi:hypothetical protein